MASNHRFAFASFFASSRQEVFIWRSIKIKTNLSGGEKTRLKVERKLGRVYVATGQVCGHLWCHVCMPFIGFPFSMSHDSFAFESGRVASANQR